MDIFEAIRDGNMKRMLYFLKVHCVDPDERDRHGQTPLHLVVGLQDGPMAIEMVCVLVQQHDADINATDAYDMTCLMHCVRRNKYDLATILVYQGADLNIACLKMTPLLEAIFHGYNDLALLLISRGADIELADVLGYTPLRLAAVLRNEIVVSVLVDRIEPKLRLSCGYATYVLPPPRRNMGSDVT